MVNDKEIFEKKFSELCKKHNIDKLVLISTSIDEDEQGGVLHTFKLNCSPIEAIGMMMITAIKAVD